MHQSLTSRVSVSVSIGAIAILAAIHLPYPFASDQALFLHIAKELQENARLYTDVWDIKQPGLFGFYYVARRLFGFDEIDVHTLDLL